MRKLRPRLAMTGARAGAERDRLHRPRLRLRSPSFAATVRAAVEGSGASPSCTRWARPIPTRSHFDAQDYMETGTPGRKGTRVGLAQPRVRRPRPRSDAVPRAGDDGRAAALVLRRRAGARGVAARGLRGEAARSRRRRGRGGGEGLRGALRADLRTIAPRHRGRHLRRHADAARRRSARLPAGRRRRVPAQPARAGAAADRAAGQVAGGARGGVRRDRRLGHPRPAGAAGRQLQPPRRRPGALDRGLLARPRTAGRTTSCSAP